VAQATDCGCFDERKRPVGKNEQTGKKAASNAGKVMGDPKSSKAAKSAAGSALTQAPNKKKSK
jgi:hypothetical protein